MKRQFRKIFMCAVFFVGCSKGPVGGTPGDLVNTNISVTSLSPTSGDVGGGTLITISGSNFTGTESVTVGGVACAGVTAVDSNTLTCTTGNKSPFGGAKDVVVTGASNTETLSGGYTYSCPWLFNGTANCGAVPPTAPSTQSTSFIVTNFQAAHGFTANAGGSHVYNDATDFTVGTQSAKIVSNAAGAAKTLRRYNAGTFDFTGKMPRITVKIDNLAKLSTAQLYLGDSSLANHFKFSFESTQGQQWTTEGDWVTFTMPWTGTHMTVVGTPNRAAITDFQFRIIDNATGAVTLHVNEISAVAESSVYTNGVVSITFDDGFESQYSVARSILSAKGFKATAYVIKEHIDTIADYMTLSNLRDLNSDGWEIAVHSYLQSTHAAGYPGLTIPDLETDIVASRAWLIENEFSGYNHCAYPKGEFDTAIMATMNTYFTSCRSIHEKHRESFPPSDSKKLRVFYITNANTLADATAAVDYAKANKEWLILVFHKLVPAPGVSTEWSSADFSTLVNYIDTQAVPVKTVGEMF